MTGPAAHLYRTTAQGDRERVCRRCAKWLPYNEVHFRSHKQGGLQSVCRVCERKADNLRDHIRRPRKTPVERAPTGTPFVHCEPAMRDLAACLGMMELFGLAIPQEPLGEPFATVLMDNFSSLIARPAQDLTVEQTIAPNWWRR